MMAAGQLVTRLSEQGGHSSSVPALLSLLDELNEISPKAMRAAVEALPELDRRIGLSLVVPWLDVGLALAASSGATALRYFKESPLILAVMDETEGRAVVLTVALEMAEQDANVTWEYIRTAPQILGSVPPDQLKAWLEIGVELTRLDIVVGLEYIRQIPALAPVLPLDAVREWLSFGLTLVTPNSLGKPDYIGTMEFMRTSPAILADVEYPAARTRVIALGTMLADQSPEAGTAWLGEAPRILRMLPSPEWQTKILQYGALLAEQDAQAALGYLRRCPELTALMGDNPAAGARFEQWFKAGVEILAYSVEGARAYFAVESQQALASVEAAVSGVPLRRVAKTVKLFVEGLCGMAVSIAALPDGLATGVRAAVSADGRIISLPALLRRYATGEENERLYLLMAAHEAGHLEFGTYRVSLESLVDVAEAVQRRYGSGGAPPTSLAALFQLYPHPRLVQDLWTVLEDARVEHLLQSSYPGLSRELAHLVQESITPRDPAHGLTAKELIVDCLLRLSTGESVSSAVPRAVREEVSVLWDLCRPVLARPATAEDIIRLTHTLYVRMEELLTPKADKIEAQQAEEEPQEPGGGPPAAERTVDTYRPVSNWVYRGVMNPEFVTRDRREELIDQDRPAVGGLASQGGGSQEGRSAAQGPSGAERESVTGEVFGGGRSLPSVVEELLAVDVDSPSGGDAQIDGARTIRYPEWDRTIQDYRLRWCRVIERPAEASADDAVSRTLTTHRSAIRSLRRYFECLRPPAFRRVAGQADGEELDIDAVVRRATEQRAGWGWDGGDRLYVRREKKTRDVAVALLVDVSGSTSRVLEEGRRVIDVERESLVLFCEALDAIGDQYGVYAYSGQGRGQVDVLTIKDFDERLGSATADRVGGLLPRQQNRDGAAIRHVTAKLLRRDAKTRLLMLLSDGRPLDGDYKDEYALEDTKAALREARRAGIDPFCVTIDREADSYLRRMYGDVQYIVVDRVDALPAKLPRIYQRLTA